MRARLDVAVAGFRAGWANAHDDDVFVRGGDGGGLLHGRAEAPLVGDDVVGRKQAEHRVGIAAQQDERRQPDCGRGIAPGRLGDDLVARQLRQLLGDRRAQVGVGDDPKMLAVGERQQALDRLLDHAVAGVIEREQLLGAALAAQRPEARAASASEDDGMESRFHS